MKKLALAAASLAVIPALASTSVFADSPGQLAGGDLYQANGKNTVTATCGDTVKYSFKLSNTEYGMLYGVHVKANLSGNTASASAQNSADEAVNVSDTVNVSVTKGSLKYASGSTKHYTVEGNLIKSLPDGITAGGVSTGNLAGSTRQFVTFEAKVDCPTTPETPETPETPGTPSTPTTPSTPSNPAMPAELPATGNEGFVAIVAAVVAAGIGYVVTFRRNLLG